MTNYSTTALDLFLLHYVLSFVGTHNLNVSWKPTPPTSLSPTSRFEVKHHYDGEVLDYVQKAEFLGDAVMPGMGTAGKWGDPQLAITWGLDQIQWGFQYDVDGI